MKPRVVSLFCGAGGMDLGFERAGFEIARAIDACADACATYRANLGGPVVHGDVTQLDAAALPPCDVVIGGPPCQGYSVAGHMGPDDPRSALTWEFVRLVEQARPCAFVMENVKALAVLRRWGAVRSRLVEAFEGLGYQVAVHVLDARWYGVPQGRERVFFIGTRPPLPTVGEVPPTCEKPLTAGEVLRRLPPPGKSPNEGPCTARVVPAKRPVLRRSPYAGMLFNGQGRPIDLGSTVNTLPASMGGNRTPIVDEEELRDGRPPWVVGYHARLMRGEAPLSEAPARLRRLSVAEAALLQTFPAGWRFAGRQTAAYRQIGNAVPPRLALAVAQAVWGALEGESGDGP
jgi:DNA (cytosine-5)-methyltransferase 1